MTIYDIVTPVLQLIANGKTAMMALFTAYIDDYLGFEIFCDKLPMEFFDLLKEDLRKSEDLRKALLDTTILEQGVGIYVARSLEDYDMWYHFLDGTKTILEDPRLVQLLPGDDRYVVKGLFDLFMKSEIDEDNWDVAYNELRIESYHT